MNLTKLDKMKIKHLSRLPKFVVKDLANKCLYLNKDEREEVLNFIKECTRKKSLKFASYSKSVSYEKRNISIPSSIVKGLAGTILVGAGFWLSYNNGGEFLVDNLAPSLASLAFCLVGLWFDISALGSVIEKSDEHIDFEIYKHPVKVHRQKSLNKEIEKLNKFNDTITCRKW